MSSGAGDVRAADACGQESQVLTQALEEFEARFASYVKSVIKVCDEERQRAATERDAFAEQEAVLVQAHEDALQAHEHMNQTVKRERNREEVLEQEKERLNKQHAELQQMAADVQSRTEELEAAFSRSQALQRERLELLRAQAQRNAPDLPQLERLTGCPLRPAGGQQLEIIITLLTETAPAQPHAVTLDLAGDAFRIVKHDPLLTDTTVRTLLAELNASNDLYAFIKQLRREMQAACRRCDG